MADRLFDAFAQRTHLAIHAENSSVTGLPVDARRGILDRLKAIATERGVTVCTCACKNPDLAKGSCRIAGKWPNTPNAAAVQPHLFD